jgi:hypothetical protein
MSMSAYRIPGLLLGSFCSTSPSGLIKWQGQLYGALEVVKDMKNELVAARTRAETGMILGWIQFSL